MAGSFFYGSGNYYNATLVEKPFSKPGTNRLNIGAPIMIPAAMRDRWEGPAVIATDTVWPRNALRGPPAEQGRLARHQAHQARQQRAASSCWPKCSTCSTGRTTAATTTQLTSANFGQPVANSGNAYVPRQGQLGVRVEF